MMPDGKALQSGTSHFLGQNFARAYDIVFLDESNAEQHVWTTSWGVSHRIMGGMLMAHGDDKGLIVPPKVAPIHVVIVPIARDDDRPMVIEKCEGLAKKLRTIQYNGENVAVKIDDREGFRPGFKFAHWELRGVPLRIEVGPRDIEEGVCVMADRLSGEKNKLSVDYATFELDGESVTSRLVGLQDALYERSREATMGRIYQVDSYEEFKSVIADGRGFVLAPWDGSAETEARVKEETSATTRVLSKEVPEHNVKCLFSGEAAKYLAYFAASY